MNTTIKDIAKRADVSTATVSNVLTQKKYVSDELMQRVYEAIAELNYRPNVYARTLKTNRSYTIGVHVPDITNPFFGEGVKFAQNILAPAGYQMMLYDADNNVETEARNLNAMLDAHVDGVIVIAPRMEIAQLVQMVNVPMIIVDHPPVKTEGNIAFVYADNYRGAATVADYMGGKGFKRFLCLAGPIETVSNAAARVNGFVETLVKHQVSKEACEIIYGDFTFDSGYGLMTEWLDKHPTIDGQTAAFVSSDIMAWGAMEALKTKKKKMPKDMGIVGYDNIYFSNFLYPRLTTVENPIREMAVNAATLILEALENQRDLNGESVVLRSSLIGRKSC